MERGGVVHEAFRAVEREKIDTVGTIQQYYLFALLYATDYCELITLLVLLIQ